MKQSTLSGFKDHTVPSSKRKAEADASNTSKRQKIASDEDDDIVYVGPSLQPPTSAVEHAGPTSAHPMRINDPEYDLSQALSKIPPKELKHKRDLDLLVFKPFLSGQARQQLFTYLRAELPFYRVTYKKGPMQIKTPRYTTVFGIDETRSNPSSYKITPRDIPMALRQLKEAVEEATQATYNFVLVNYYSDGKDSISYHSDDERFLGLSIFHCVYYTYRAR